MSTSESETEIRVRIAPSPTGLFHIGTARTALYNYLFARKYKGTMILRIEDTDKERSTKEYEENILSGMKKIGITYDEGPDVEGKYGPYRQSERTELYKKYLIELLLNDQAYYCFCPKERLEELKKEQMAKKLAPRYDGHCAELDSAESMKRVEKKGEKAVIRLRTQKISGGKAIRFEDLVRGETVLESTEFDDFIIARSINEPLYNFTVVVDDISMKISHVIRGEDHISNTPKQILIYEALGQETIPKFAHLPLILNEDKSKLSKRKNQVSVDDFLDDGYLPEALINFLALLGWNAGGEQEIFSMNELIEKFSLDRVHKGGAVFDLKRLDWINGEYIKRMVKENIDEFYKRAYPYVEGRAPQNPELIKRIFQDPDFDGRFKKLLEIWPAISPLFSELPAYNLSLLMPEKFQITKDMLKAVFEKAKEVVKGTEWEKGDSSKAPLLSDAFAGIVTNLGFKNGQVLWPIRVALSGLEKSPNFATLAVYLGKDEVLKRLDAALKKVV